MHMPFFIWALLGFLALRLAARGGWRRGRRWERAGRLEEKIERLEARVAELQEQAEQDRSLLERLEEERDFFRRLYPGEAGGATEPGGAA